MTKVVYPQDEGEVVVDLRKPHVAALLAWLWPGAGHIYQRRFPKGLLFMVCVLSIYCTGLALGEGRVVYSAWKPGDYRWQYFCQLGVGIPAWPAIAQSMRVNAGDDPLFVLCERFPEESSKKFERIPADFKKPEKMKTFKDGFMAPPAGPFYDNDPDVLGMWHFELKHFFDMGTLYTVVAGLLNLLAVFDSFSGPAILTNEEREAIDSKNEKKKKSA